MHITVTHSHLFSIDQTDPDKAPNIAAIKGLLSKFGGGNDSDLDHGEQLKAESKAYRFDPNNVCPPDVQKKLLDLLKWHDNIMRSIEEKIEMVPGLSSLLDQLSNDLNACQYIRCPELQYHLMDIFPPDIYTVLAPYIGVSILIPAENVVACSDISVPAYPQRNDFHTGSR